MCTSGKHAHFYITSYENKNKQSNLLVEEGNIGQSLPAMPAYYALSRLKTTKNVPAYYRSVFVQPFSINISQYNYFTEHNKGPLCKKN